MALGAVAAFLAWHAGGRALMERMYAGRFIVDNLNVPADLRATHTAAEFYAWLDRVLLGLAAVAGAVAAFAWLLPARSLSTWASGRHARLLSVGVSSLASLVLLYSLGYEGEWMKLRDMLSFTQPAPAVHRLLFVLLARSMQLVTGGSDLLAYFVSQVVAIVLAMWAVLRWAEVFVARETALFAPVLATLMLAPTIAYYTFYDFGIVFFFAIGLLLLLRGRFAAYLAVLAIGTLNHELILFLIVIAALLTHDRYPRSRWLGFIGSQLLIYMAVRVGLFLAIPATRAWVPGNVWRNIEYLAVRQHALANTLVLFIWFALAMFFIVRYGPGALRRCLWLLPLLLAMTLLVGNLNETRQFVAFIPVAVAGILCAWRPGGAAAAPDVHATRREVAATGN
jgi:hypothetical protein